MAQFTITREMLTAPENYHGDKPYRRDKLAKGVKAAIAIKWRARSKRGAWHRLRAVRHTNDLPFAVRTDLNAEKEFVVLVDVDLDERTTGDELLVRLVLPPESEPVAASAPPAPARINISRIETAEVKLVPPELWARPWVEWEYPPVVQAALDEHKAVWQQYGRGEELERAHARVIKIWDEWKAAVPEHYEANRAWRNRRQEEQNAYYAERRRIEAAYRPLVALQRRMRKAMPAHRIERIGALNELRSMWLALLEHTDPAVANSANASTGGLSAGVIEWEDPREAFSPEGESLGRVTEHVDFSMSRDGSTWRAYAYLWLGDIIDKRTRQEIFEGQPPNWKAGTRGGINDVFMAAEDAVDWAETLERGGERELDLDAVY